MTLREKLAGGCLVIDGAMGTQLFARGAGRANPELWGIEHRNALLDIHRSYIVAGSRGCITNTFGGTRLKLGKAGLGDRMDELNRAAAQIAREAAGDSAFVLGDVGPTGEFMEPVGLLAEDDLIATFREQIAALVAGGVDGIIIETVMDPGEGACAVRAAREVAPDLPVLASMTFEKNPHGFRTMMGTSPEQAVEAMAAAGADVVGANCGGITPEDFVELMQIMHNATDLPLLAEPNAGLPQVDGDRTIYSEPPETFAKVVPLYRDAGVRVFGGCCGTGPEHIRAIAEVVGKG